MSRFVKIPSSECRHCSPFDELDHSSERLKLILDFHVSV
jgi:hypothetical protein